LLYLLSYAGNTTFRWRILGLLTVKYNDSFKKMINFFGFRQHWKMKQRLT